MGHTQDNTCSIKKLQKELGMEEDGELSEELMDGLKKLTEKLAEIDKNKNVALMMLV